MLLKPHFLSADHGIHILRVIGWQDRLPVSLTPCTAVERPRSIPETRDFRDSQSRSREKVHILRLSSSRGSHKVQSSTTRAIHLATQQQAVNLLHLSQDVFRQCRSSDRQDSSTQRTPETHDLCFPTRDGALPTRSNTDYRSAVAISTSPIARLSARKSWPWGKRKEQEQSEDC